MKKIQKLLIVYFSSVILLFGLLLIYLDTILLFLAKDSIFNFEYYSLTIISISIGIIFFGLNTFYENIIMLAKKNKYKLAIEILGLILSILINLWLIPIFGLLGAGIATMLGYLFIIICNHYFFPINFNKEFFLYFLSALISLFIMIYIDQLINNQLIYVLLFNIFISIFIYAFSQYLLYKLFKIKFPIYN